MCALAALLAISPFGFDLDGGSFTQAEAAAGGNGKGNGNAGAHSHGGANSQAGANRQGGRLRRGNKYGSSKVNIANGQLKSKSKNELGRLNAFMHASSKALQNAKPNSAIGIVAVQYRDAISTYVDGIAQGQEPTLDAAAAILAKAANKELTPEMVAAINTRLAAENPDNLSLSILAADPTANTLLATDLSTLANTLQETEPNQGLGPNGNSEVNIANGQLKSKSKNELGRLNAFMHASSKALQNAKPNSAIGIVAVQYRDAISAYLDEIAQGQQPTLDAAAAILAKAANKELTPEMVAAINTRLAAENPDNLSLSILAADPSANTLLATDLSTLANTLQQTEANQGLGPPY
jgi:lactam utilization protein B